MADTAATKTASRTLVCFFLMYLEGNTRGHRRTLGSWWHPFYYSWRRLRPKCMYKDQVCLHSCEDPHMHECLLSSTFVLFFSFCAEAMWEAYQ
jgi:hypothetical protein